MERRRAGPFWARLILTLALLVTYANSFRGVFVLDDYLAIQQNSTIADLSDLGQVLSPPRVSAVTARPFVNLTLAVDYALWGLDVRGYHVTNLLIHVGAALLVFGIVRRVWGRRERQNGTDARSGPTTGNANRSSSQATLWAAVIAAVWALHPLQTESVTFIVMRSESLAGLFYLLTIYAFIRYAEEGRLWGWAGVAVASSSLGMMSKEYVVSIPLLVLAFDWMLYAGSLRSALRTRRWLYLGLALSWLPLVAVLVQSGADRAGTGGFGTVLTPWHYLLTSCRALVIYLRLAFWPDALCFDYGRAVIRDVWSVAPQALLLLGLAGATAVGLWRRSLLGFAGLWFFAIIAPSSSIVPLASQTAAEHRMYLPLLAVVVVVAVVAHRYLGNRGWIVLMVTAPVLGVMTFNRNALYADPIALWQDTVDKQPNNARARNNLGVELLGVGRVIEAVAHLEAANEAMRERESSFMSNLALALLELGRLEEAQARAQRSYELDPKCSDAYTALAAVAARRGQLEEARDWMDKATALAPGNKETLLQRGRILWRMGKPEEAAREYRHVLEMDKDNSMAEFWLGRIAFDAGKWSEAVARYGRAVRLNPSFAEAHNNLAGALANAGDNARAIEHYAKAVELSPKLTSARFAYATMLAQAGRLLEAEAQYEIALGQEPANVENLINSGMALQLLGRIEKARARYGEALRLEPGNTVAQARLAALPAAAGKRE